MATFNKFNAFVGALAAKKHDLGSDLIKIALCTNANAPIAGDAVLGDLTEILYTNLSTRDVTTTSSGETGGTYTLALTDLTLTASGGSIAAFRYVVIYNDTSTNDDLIGYADYGSDLTLADGESLTIDFNASTITIV